MADLKSKVSDQKMLLDRQRMHFEKILDKYKIKRSVMEVSPLEASEDTDTAAGSQASLTKAKSSGFYSAMTGLVPSLRRFRKQPTLADVVMPAATASNASTARKKWIKAGTAVLQPISLLPGQSGQEAADAPRLSLSEMNQVTTCWRGWPEATREKIQNGEVLEAEDLRGIATSFNCSFDAMELLFPRPE